MRSWRMDLFDFQWTRLQLIKSRIEVENEIILFYDINAEEIDWL